MALEEGGGIGWHPLKLALASGLYDGEKGHPTAEGRRTDSVLFGEVLIFRVGGKKPQE